MNREYKKEELEKLHHVLTDELAAVAKICDDNHLPYYLLGGTAIGAVRHKGFVPWDDDVDIGLLRDDYEKLLTLLPTQLPEHLSFDNVRTDKNFPALNTCVYKKGTLCVPVEMKNNKYQYGIGMGIFPMDDVSDDLKIRKKQCRRCFFWGRIHWLKTMPFPYTSYRGIKRYTVYAICGIVHIGLYLIPKSFIVNRYESAALLAHGTSDSVATLTDSDLYGSICTKDMLLPTQDAAFEHLTVKLAHKNHEMLTNLFGDYMQLPPVEDRKNHFPCRLDFGEND